MQSNTHIILNMQAPNVAVVVNAKQGDKLSRVITADLVDGDIPFIPPSGVAAAVRYFKPDNTIGFYDVTEDGAAAIVLDGSTATVTLAEQALTVPGNVYAEINFYTSTEKLTTFNFIIHVQKSAVSDQMIESTDYFSVLTEKINAILGAAVNPPYINPDNKHWMLWSETAGAYVDSGYSSIGLVPPSTVTYQTGTSGITPPAGTWTATIPTVPQGAYLWTRTQFEFSDGTQQVSYSVARQGLDGTGSVRTVNENSPDENGNVYVMTVNPSLLDNGYFVNPVDQRKGYIAPKGTQLYGDESLSNFIVESATAAPVVKKTETYCKIEDPDYPGSYYYCSPNSVVRGYTGTGYTIDRWFINEHGLLLINDDCISIEGVHRQYIENGIKNFAEKHCCFSMLTKNGELYSASAIVPANGVGQFYIKDDVTMYSYADGNTMSVVIETYNGKIIQLIAAKLELGDKQTLANKGSSENWVLNEIPNYADQLARCQRYYKRIYEISFAVSANAQGTEYFSSGVYIGDMRIVPTLRMIENASGNVGVVQSVKFVTADEIEITPNGKNNSILLHTANSAYAGMALQLFCIEINADL